MKHSNASATDAISGQEQARLTPEQALEIWKHYANTGGADKDRMITIATWLLALSATAIGYAATNFVEFNPEFWVKDPEKAATLAVLGLFVSFTGTIVVLVFAGYANWNWDKADEFAEKYGLQELLPANRRAVDAKPKGFNRIVLNIANLLATPRDPRTELAPVFWIFLALAAASFLVHLVLLGLALG